MDDVSYEHFTYFPSEAPAQTFAADFQQRGVLVEAPRPAAAGTDWLVMAYTAFDDRTAWAEAFAEAAERLGGEYDGGGTLVGPPPASESPQPVAGPPQARADQPAEQGAQTSGLWARIRSWFG